MQRSVLFADQAYYLVGVRESTGGTSGVFTAYVKTPSGVFQEVISVDDPDGESIYEDEGSGSCLCTETADLKGRVQ